jgi:hypothetical protein
MRQMLLSILIFSGLGIVGMPTAWGDLILTITPDSLSATPGGTIEFTGTLMNTGGSELFLNGDLSELGYSGLTVDDSPFFSDAPLSLDPDGSYTGPLFDVVVSSGTPAGTYAGSFTVQGGTDANAVSNLATQNFQVNVGAVPEPRSVGFILIGMSTIVFLSRKRHKPPVIRG